MITDGNRHVLPRLLAAVAAHFHFGGEEVDELEVERIKEEIEGGFEKDDDGEEIASPRADQSRLLANDDDFEDDMKELFGDLQKDQADSSAAVLAALGDIQRTLAAQAARLDAIESKVG